MKVSDRFGPIPQTVVLDSNGQGSVTFQAVGDNVRISTLFVKVSTVVKQAQCLLYKGQIASSNIIGNTNSGSTGAPAFGNIDLLDGETLYVQWTGGDAGATATATFTGQAIPFSEVGATSLQWSDPIAAGDGSLIYPAIKSPNYVAGVSGWAIMRDGSVEFANGTYRGDVLVADGIGGYIEITTQAPYGGVIFLQPDPSGLLPLAPLSPGVLYADVNDFVGPNTSPYTKLVSPQLNNGATAAIVLHGRDYTSATDNSYVDLQGDNITVNGTYVGTGWVCGAHAFGNSPATGLTEAVYFGLANPYTFKQGHAYEIHVSGQFSTNTVNTRGVFRMRTSTDGTSNLGTQIGANGAPATIVSAMTNGGFTCGFICSSASITTYLVLSLTSGSGSVNITGLSPFTFDVFDIGAATDHPGWVAIS